MPHYRIVDVECYRNFFLLLALDPETGTVYRWERHNDLERGRSHDELRDLIKSSITVTFNGDAYDWWMLSAYLKGYANSALKKLSDWIITTPMAQWKVQDRWNIYPIPGRHIDLFPVAPLIASLKIYAGRLNAPKLQDLPVAPDTSISEKLRDILIDYCVNDLHATRLLHNKLKPQVLLRHRMGKRYGLKILSKSDAQIAELVIKKMLRDKDVMPYRPEKIERSFSYEPPQCIQLRTSPMRQGLKAAVSATFELSAKGALLCPPSVRQPITYNSRDYQMGIGGLHSMEKSQSIRVGPGESLTDLDVTSYYPSLILTNELYPEHLGRKFLDVYQQIVATRVAAKRAGDSVTADALKIVINSSFGKFGNRYSVLYSPKLLLQTTLSGQLYLLALIELIELRTSCAVISANTDGITVYSPNPVQYKRMREVATQWEVTTSMALEAVEYKALFIQDVNNYLAVKLDGSTKGKGVFAPTSLSKNPNAPIVQLSVIKLLTEGVRISTTINECRDISMFAMLRKVTGGAIYQDVKVGSTVRWYQSNRGGPILYAKNLNRVPDASEAMLINELPASFPIDVDYTYYITRATELMGRLGYGSTNTIPQRVNTHA